MTRIILMFPLSCLFIKCEPIPYFFNVNFHFMSENKTVKISDIVVEMSSKKKSVVLDSVKFTICPNCDRRYIFGTDSGYLVKTLMTDLYEFYEDELPIKINVILLDSLKQVKNQLVLVVDKSKPSSVHGCLIYIANQFNKDKQSIDDFYTAAMSEAHDSLRIQSTSITGSSDSLFVIYVD